MKKIAILSLFGLSLAMAITATANVTVVSQPASLIPDPIVVPASSGQIGLFEFSLNQDAGESLSSVSILIQNNATSLASSTDFASVSVYKDNGDGVFNSSSDLLAGMLPAVNIGSQTQIATGVNNAIDGGKFFVSISTSATWSDTAPADSITATLSANGVVTSDNSPSTAAVTTHAITADTTMPNLMSTVAKNTGGTAAKEAGDSIELTFSETTNKPDITAGNIASILSLNNSKSFLDADGALGGAIWNVEGTILTITLSGTTTATSTIPTVEVGNVVTISSSAIKDLAGNIAAGSRTITGSFAGEMDDDEDGDDEEKHSRTRCANSLINGRLYKIDDEATVYLAAACRLKPFRGAAVFHARGHKFENIIMLDSLPEDVTINQKPVLPAIGTLIKGSGPTVWFIADGQKRRGFISAHIFLALGFRFDQVESISDGDLETIPTDSPISAENEHPAGALMKCGNSATVFQVVGGAKFPFQSADAFLTRGHAWHHIAIVDCGRFRYMSGAPVK